STGHDSDSAYTLTVDVQNMNEAPTGADFKAVINENEHYRFNASNFAFNDPNTWDSLTSIRIDTLPSKGTLMLNGTAVTAGQIILVTDIGNLVYTPPKGHAGNS